MVNHPDIGGSPARCSLAFWLSAARSRYLGQKLIVAVFLSDLFQHGDLFHVSLMLFVLLGGLLVRLGLVPCASIIRSLFDLCFPGSGFLAALTSLGERIFTHRERQANGDRTRCRLDRDLS